MSALVGLLVAVGLLLARGPRGRPPARVEHRGARVGGARPGPLDGRPWSRLRRPHRDGGRPDLAAVAVDVAARLRAGAEPAAAWHDAVGVRVAPGSSPALDDLAAVGGDRAHAAVVVAAGRLAAELGTPLADLLDDVARQLATEAELDGERRAALAGPRATARVLTALPALGVVLGVAVGADPLAVLLDGSYGSAALACGVLLLWAGQVWTRRLAAHAAAVGRPS